mgnify:CR=1 FL=1
MNTQRRFDVECNGNVTFKKPRDLFQQTEAGVCPAHRQCSPQSSSQLTADTSVCGDCGTEFYTIDNVADQLDAEERTTHSPADLF